jgi:hypothetical protein
MPELEINYLLFTVYCLQTWLQLNLPISTNHKYKIYMDVWRREREKKSGSRIVVCMRKNIYKKSA